jgi:hypothetical protein
MIYKHAKKDRQHNMSISRTNNVKEAELVLNSYDTGKIASAIANIKKSNSQLNITLGAPKNHTSSKPVKPKIWGCETNDLKRKIMSVSGSQEDMTKLLLKLKVTEGVYIQLLPKH